MTNRYQPLTAPISTGGGGDFQPAPAGVWPARLYRIVDLGHQPETFDGETKMRQKILLSFELLDESANQADGKPSTCHRRFTFSLHQQSALRPFIDSWRGRKLTDSEVAVFDFSNLLGQCCLLNVVHSERAGRTRADISSVMPLPRNITPPTGINPLVLFTASSPDLALLDTMGRGLRESIEASPEFQRAMGAPQQTPRTTTGPQARPAPAPATTPQPPAQPNAYAALRGGDGYRRATPPPPPIESTDFDDDVPF